jgi:hypothetical protein
MLEIGKTIVSLELINAHFTCDLHACKGACCVTGDSGAPLEPREVDILKDIFPVLRSYLSEDSVKSIEKQGTSVIDIEKDTVTPLNDGKECAYVVFENEIAFCAIEKAYLDGVISFRKPVSCHLYPIRIKKYREYDAVNYDRWEICQGAVLLGKSLSTPVFRFTREALIRKYGFEWYDMLKIAADHLSIELNP